MDVPLREQGFFGGLLSLAFGSPGFAALAGQALLFGAMGVQGHQAGQDFVAENDRFWFIFFHEAGHILNDSKKATFEDSDGEKSSVEDQANAFAADLLIPRRHAAEMATLDGDDAIVAVAKPIGIHPGIVVGRMQNDRLLDWGQGNGLKQTVGWSSVRP